MKGREALPLHAQLPWFGFAPLADGAAGPRTILAKSGELLAGARLQGAPYEGRSAADLDFVAQRWTQALKSLEPGWRLRWQVRKRRLADLPRRTPADPVAARAETARRAHLLRRGLYEIETSVFWLWDPELAPAPPPGRVGGPLRGLLERGALWFSPERTRRLLSGQLAAAVARFESAVGAFQGLVADVTPLRSLEREELFRELAASVNATPAARAARPLGPGGLDRQLALSDLEAHRAHLLLDTERVETYALLDPPPQSRAHLFGAILDLAADLDLAAEWRREDTARSRRRIRSAQRHYHQQRYSLLAHASGGDEAPQARGALADQAAEAQASQLGEALRELEVDGLPFGEHSLTVALRGADAAALDAVRPRLLRIATAADARFHRETYNGLNAFLALAPGNHRRQLRANYVSAAVAADLAPLWALAKGSPRDAHLAADCLAVFETRRRTPYFFCAHEGDVAHALVVGATGSGKSFLLNFLLAHARQYRPRVCILDLGGSYRHLTDLVGGAYLALSGSPDTDPCRLNPFRALPPTPDNLHFLESFVRLLLETEGKACDAPERAELREQIRALYQVAPEARTLSSLRELLPKSLRAPLAAWTGSGSRGAVFDHPEDTLTLADWQVLDLAGAENRPDLARALLFYLLRRFGAAVAAPAELARWKLLVVDEAWRFLADPRVGAALAEGLKTWRKANAAVILATQSPGDAARHADLSRTIAESCLTKLFLANPELDPADYAAAFGLSAAEAAAIRGLVPKRQALLRRPGLAQVLELDVDPRSYWLYTTQPLEAARRQAAIAELGFDRGLDSLLEEPHA